MRNSSLISYYRLQSNSSTNSSPSKPGDSNGLPPHLGAFHGDPGYDSYSLSSNDSYPLQQSLKHSLQVVRISFEIQMCAANKLPFL